MSRKSLLAILVLFALSQVGCTKKNSESVLTEAPVTPLTTPSLTDSTQPNVPSLTESQIFGGSSESQIVPKKRVSKKSLAKRKKRSRKHARRHGRSRRRHRAG